MARPAVEVAGLVLCAGLGTRIAPLSERRPKPLLPIAATTPLARATAALRTAGAARVVANASHRSAQIEQAAGSIDVEVVVEQDGPLGTAGGLACARERLDADVVAIWNGDIVSDLDLLALVHLLRDRGEARAALAVRGRSKVGEGNVGIGDDGRVVRLRSRSYEALGPERFGAYFTGVHAMRRDVVERAPSRGCLVSDVYLPMLAEQATLLARFDAPTDARWHDIGDLASYLDANLDLLKGAASLVGQGARVAAGVVLDRCVVGEGARVEGQGVLREVVVWPFARAIASLERAVVVDDAGSVVRVPAR